MKKIISLLFLLLLAALPGNAQKEYGLTFSNLVSDNLTLENLSL